MNSSDDGSSRAPHVPLTVAFETFYRHQYRPVATLVLTLVGSATVAEDITQDAFLRAHRHWNQVAVHPNPDAWIRRVATNLAISRFRRLRAETRALLRLGRPSATVPPPEPDADHFWREVRRLPTRQAQIVALHYVEDRSVADIAEVLTISQGTVKTQLHRARKTLADRLGRPDNDTGSPTRKEVTP